MLRSHRHHPSSGELPATLLRSSQEAQDTFTVARQDAMQTHGETDEATWAAFAVLKETFEKRGDHWIAKQQSAD